MLNRELLGGLNQPRGRGFSHFRLLAEHLKLDKNVVSATHCSQTTSIA